MTYNVFGGTLNPAQSTIHCCDIPSILCIHRVPKNTPDIFCCNLNKHYSSLIIFRTYITKRWAIKSRFIFPPDLNMFLHYMVKQTNTKIASFYSNAMLVVCKLLIIKCLLTVSFSCQICLQQMFEPSPLCANTLQTLSPLSDGSVANALLQTTPDIKQSLLEFINIVDPYFIDTPLYNFPKSCSQRGSGQGCWVAIAPEK